jgi:repressor LexA
MMGLTEKQARIYKFISERLTKDGYPPTQTEIRDHFKFGSVNAVRSHLALIEKKGYIGLNSGKARGIQLVQTSEQKGAEEKAIPLIGRIAAGVPILAVENIEKYLPVSPAMFGGGDLFALHVQGDSMTGAGILNGDMAVITSCNRVENGDIAAVLIEDDATLKRFYLSSERLVLKSENPLFEDLTYPSNICSDIRVLGRYLGIIRKSSHW